MGGLGMEVRTWYGVEGTRGKREGASWISRPRLVDGYRNG